MHWESLIVGSGDGVQVKTNVNGWGSGKSIQRRRIR